MTEPESAHMIKLALLGQSHAVCIMDVFSEHWRSDSGLVSDNHKNSNNDQYSTMFSGWFNDTSAPRVIDVVLRPQWVNHIQLKAMVIGGAAGKTSLALLHHEPGKPDSFDVSPALQSFINICDRETVILILLDSGTWQLMSLVDLLPAHDFSVEGIETPKSHQHAQWIDRTHIETALASSVEDIAIPLTALRIMLPETRMVYFAPPPPIEQPRLIKHTEVFGPILSAGHEFNPAWLRQKWYATYLKLIDQMLTPLDVKKICLPRQMLTSDGLLPNRLAEGLTHGNRHYGEVMVEQLLTSEALP